MGDRLLRLGGAGMSMGQNSAPTDAPVVDTAEQVYISSLALLKMLKHGRAGVPMEVMGLMLGEFVDEYTVRVIDVFAMPQSGTGVSVEAVDPVFQAKMLDMLKQTGRPEMVVGWYHSHPGFGPRTSTDNFSLGTFTETFDTSPHSRSEQTLLFHCYKLQKKRIGTAHVDELEQKVMDGRFDIT